MKSVEEIIHENILDIIQHIKDIRQRIHENPELGYEEYETTKLIKEALCENNVEFFNFNNLTGGIAYINANKEKTVAFRADIDALPILENTCIDFQSHNHGKMHACGHDIHTSIATGVAIVLNRLKGFLNCNVAITFQPAEECNPIGGAKLVLDQEVFKELNISEMYGLHIWPSLKIGEIALKPGPLMGASDKFCMTIKGKKSHAAEPHKGVDAISISLDIINAIEHKLRREVDPFDISLISIGSIKSTGRYNVICDNVEIEGTIRTTKEETRLFIHKRIKELAEGIAGSYNGEAVVNITNGYSVVNNDEILVERFIKKASHILGIENVRTDIKTSLIGEDFSFYCDKIPSLYFFLGCESEYPLHSDKFLPSDKILGIAIELLVSYFLDVERQIE